VWAVAGLLAATMSWRTAHATFDDFGQIRGVLSGPYAPWHAGETINRLLWAAGEKDDLCGLALVDIGPVWTGGFSYLHRDVPIVWGMSGALLAQPGLGAVGSAANYVVAGADVALPAEYATVETIGAGKLARRPGPCAAPPAEFTRLFTK
jgi:hypothetical protein